MSAGSRSVHGPGYIYRVLVSGSTGRITDTIRLSSGKSDRNSGGVQFWVQDGRIVGPMQPGRTIGIWRYPTGGRYAYKITSMSSAYGTTISLAPKP